MSDVRHLWSVTDCCIWQAHQVSISTKDETGVCMCACVLMCVQQSSGGSGGSLEDVVHDTKNLLLWPDISPWLYLTEWAERDRDTERKVGCISDTNDMRSGVAHRPPH